MALGAKPIRPKKYNVQPMINAYDPLAESHRTERAQEDDYFRRRDQELIGALREQSAVALEEARRHSACMCCPRCGEFLEETPSYRITSKTCPGCGGGIWLNKGEWEGLVELQEPGWLQRLFAGVLSR